MKNPIMEYNEHKFRRHYGKPYLMAMKYLVWLDVASVATILLLAMLRTLYGTTVPVILGISIMFPLAATIFLLPILYCMYLGRRNKARHQSQWFDEIGGIHVELVPEDGFVWGGFEHHKILNTIDAVSDVKVTTQYIIITGVIQVADFWNGTITEKTAHKLKIPRVFNNEDFFLKRIHSRK